MKRLLVAVLLSIFWGTLITAQTNASGTVWALGQATEQSKFPGLTEADQLSAQVVELYRKGQYDDAVPLATRAIEIRAGVLGPDHPLVSVSAHNLAKLYIAQGKLKDAEPLLLRAIEINDKTLKPADPVVVRTLEQYTCLMYGANQLKELKEFEQRRNQHRAVTTEADQFWGALWGQTKAITMPKPEFPASLKRTGINESILVAVTLDEEGKVVKAEAMCAGNPLLIKGSIAAANGARFNPLMLGGHPVKAIGYVTYRFVTP